MRCAFSGREIDVASAGWLKTPDGKVVLAQFYEGYIARMRKAQAVAQVQQGEPPVAEKTLEVKLEEVAPAPQDEVKPKADKKKPGPKPKAKKAENVEPQALVEVVPDAAPAEPEAPAADPTV